MNVKRQVDNISGGMTDGRQSVGRPTGDLSCVEFESSENVVLYPRFEDMHLREDVVRGIYAYGMSFDPPYGYFFLFPRQYATVMLLF